MYLVILFLFLRFTLPQQHKPFLLDPYMLMDRIIKILLVYQWGK